MMSRVLHSLAGSDWAKAFVLHFPPAVWASRRFVAGETLEDAVPALKALHAAGLFGMLDQLGESVTVEADARRAAEDYLRGLEQIRLTGLPANVSLKLTQMGLDISDELCRENVRAVAEAAHKIGCFVELDMESSAYVDRTLAIHAWLHEQLPNTGVCVQAYLHRALDDARRLADMGARVRLVKGAYLEPPAVAIQNKPDVDANYRRMLEVFFSESAVARGVHCGVASHDPAMIDAALELVRARSLPADKWEFQMLYGIARDQQTRLSREGWRVRVYVTYGSQWYPYFMRRMAERPANLWFVLRHLAG